MYFISSNHLKLVDGEEQQECTGEGEEEVLLPAATRSEAVQTV